MLWPPPVLTHELPVDALVDVIQLVRTHPVWDSGNDSTDHDKDWRRVEWAAVELIESLAASDADFGDRLTDVWDFLEAEATNLSEPSLILSQSTGYDPYQSARNRPCTRALDTAIHLLASEYRSSSTVSAESCHWPVRTEPATNRHRWKRT